MSYGPPGCEYWAGAAHPAFQPHVAALPPPFGSLLPGAKPWGHAQPLAPEMVQICHV